MRICIPKKMSHVPLFGKPGLVIQKAAAMANKNFYCQAL
jgi:hypothetical protein